MFAGVTRAARGFFVVAAELPLVDVAVIALELLLGVKLRAVVGQLAGLALAVLADAEVRQGIKEFSNWPTIPQLYVKGEFVGGCDIVKEMFEQGELDGFLKERGVSLDNG